MKTVLLDYQLPSQLTKIIELVELVDEVLGNNPKLAHTVNLCLDELITNIILHGLNNASDHIINVCISLIDESLEVVVEDDAPQFNPFEQAPIPELDLILEQKPIGGLGVHIVKQLMDDYSASYDGQGNRIVLRKSLKNTE